MKSRPVVGERLHDAGYSRKLLYELRRSAVRNMERAGLSRSVALHVGKFADSQERRRDLGRANGVRGVKSSAPVKSLHRSKTRSRHACPYFVYLNLPISEREGRIATSALMRVRGCSDNGEQ